MLECVLLLATLLLVILHVCRKCSGDGQESNCPPGSLGWPFIGETIEFARKKVAFFTERHQLYGRVYKTHLFGRPTVRVYGTESIKTILKGENKYLQSSYPASVRILLGKYAISMMHGEEHTTTKCQLMKYLCPAYLNNHVPVISAFISERVDVWSQQESVDLYKECRQLFIELAARFLIKMDIGETELKELCEQLEIFTNNIFCLPINLPGFGLRKALNAKQRMREIIAKVINTDTNNNNSDELASVLERMRNSTFDDADVSRDVALIDTIIDLLFSGTESMSSSGFSLALELMNNEIVVQKIRDELFQYDLLSMEESLTAHTLQDLSYIDNVVKETLRVMPPVGGGYRRVTETFQLDGYTIPKDWSLVFSIRETHRNNSAITDCQRFNPDNWLTGSDTRDKYSYVPFGGGARVCAGQAYAKLVLKLFTVELSRRCTGQVTSECEIIMWPTPRPDGELLVKIQKAEFTQSL